MLLVLSMLLFENEKLQVSLLSLRGISLPRIVFITCDDPRCTFSINTWQADPNPEVFIFYGSERQSLQTQLSRSVGIVLKQEKN